MSEDLTHNNLVEFFPDVNPGVQPLGNNIIVQGIFVKEKTSGGIIMLSETRDAKSYDIQIGKVIAMGPLAYKNKQTLEAWKEGNWCEIGDLIQFPRSGYRMTRRINGNLYHFVTISDIDPINKITDIEGLSLFE